MSLNVCATSTQSALAIADELRALLGTTATSEDQLMTAHLQAATEWAEDYVGFPLRVQVYSETIPAFGTRNLMLGRTPIRNILQLATTTDPSNYTLVTSSGYKLEDKDAGILSRDIGFDDTVQQRWLLSPSELSESNEKPWWAVYEAGYVGGGLTSTGGAWGGTTSTVGGLGAGQKTLSGLASTSPDLPLAIKQAILFKAREWYLNEDRFASKKVGDFSYVLKSERQSGPAESLLRPYQALVRRIGK